MFSMFLNIFHPCLVESTYMESTDTESVDCTVDRAQLYCVYLSQFWQVTLWEM
jgi:hypothetical protein